MRRAVLTGLLVILVLATVIPASTRADDSASVLTVIGYDPDSGSQMGNVFQVDSVMLKIVVTNITVYLDANGPRVPSNAIYLNVTNMTILAGENKVVHFRFPFYSAGTFSILNISYTRDVDIKVYTVERLILANRPYSYDQGSENLRVLLFFGAPFGAAFLFQLSTYVVSNQDVRARMPSKDVYKSSLLARLQYWPYYWAENGWTVWVVLVWLFFSTLIGLLGIVFYVLFILGFS
jgi:hypothetical protein